MPLDAETQRLRIRSALNHAGTTVEDLWTHYLAVGGTAGAGELQAFVEGDSPLAARERDRMALALNDILEEEVGRHRVPYTRTVRELEPTEGPLAALVELLLATHLTSPDQVPAAVDVATARLGLRAVAYVVDYSGGTLMPMTGSSGERREPVNVDGTVPGRAFRLLQTVTSTSDGRPHLWMPIIDGVERIGVLDVMVADEEDLEDPVLRRHTWWLTHYLGHLIAALDQYGDGIDALRRRRPRTTEAELVWNLLPPITAGTDKVIVSGRLEPAYEVGGDVFDYALSPRNARFAVIDATGHDLSAGLASAASLAAYRNARRNGKGLFEQAEAVHRTLAEQFDGDVFATGAFADLDVESGRLRYLVAGHPSPLLLRRGRVVKQLAGGRRPLLGLDLDLGVELGEESLEPGDTVVMFTDGITEARNPQGRQFGMSGLVETLQRETSRGLPLPEVVDRLVQAVLRYESGRPRQDDATLVLVQWTTEGQAALEPAPPR